MLFLEREPLETLEPTVRLLAPAMIEKDLLFVYKPFEVVTCIIFFPCLKVFLLATRQGLILFFFFFSCLFVDLFETSSYLKVAFLLLMYCLILLFSHTSFLLTYPTSTFNRWYVCYMFLDTYMLLLNLIPMFNS